MPTYQYACTECSHSFEQVQSFADDALTVCPVCQGRLRKVYNAVGVVFKGSGFYRNDSRAPDAKDAGSSDKASGSEPGSGSGSDTKTDSSTSTKSDAGPTTKTESKPAPTAASSGSSGSSSTSSTT